jgi:hypothetical protein
MVKAILGSIEQLYVVLQGQLCSSELLVFD